MIDLLAIIICIFFACILASLICGYITLRPIWILIKKIGKTILWVFYKSKDKTDY